MKNLILTLPLIWFCPAASGQGVLLGPGDTYTFEFSSLSYLGAASPNETNVGRLAVAFDSFAGGETVQADRFRDSLGDTPISWLITLPTPSNPNDSIVIVPPWRYNDPPFWTDMQGIVRITGITGTVGLEGIIVNELINGGIYGAYFAAPEPYTFSLLLLGVGCFTARRLLHDRPTNNVSGANAAGRFALRIVRVILRFASCGRAFSRRIGHSQRSTANE